MRLADYAPIDYASLLLFTVSVFLLLFFLLSLLFLYLSLSLSYLRS